LIWFENFDYMYIDYLKMVKNTIGGSKHKGLARKNVNSIKQATKLRVATEDGEIYAIVTKLLGGARCSVIGMDKVERACIIRGKFRGGQRRDNTLKAGTLVLVGDRDWITEKSNKLRECDLLEVYSDIDKERLKKSVTSVDWSFANIATGSKTEGDSADDLVFSNDTTQDEYAELMKTEISLAAKGASTTITFGTDGGDVDIDDI
jgi:translation initiation factor IF-1